MPSITFYPLGNADCYRIDLAAGQKLLFDYANTRCADQPDDKRADLPVELRKDLKNAKRNHYDVVAFTHLDEDHVCGAAEFFYLEHASKYQGPDRVTITEMWVPAHAITESNGDLCGDAKIIQAEARHRLKAGRGIRVFSRPEALKAWLESNGLTLESRRTLITDAGGLVPNWTTAEHGVEFFVHSPFAERHNDGTFVDRNSCSLVFQATFVVEGKETKALLMADTVCESMEEIVRITKFHNNEHRLEWDIAKLPHHCSYRSLASEKGEEKTTPVDDVAWVYEQQGRKGCRIISTSDCIPSDDRDQPPHRQAANYYRDLMRETHSGQFLVTMEEPTKSKPAPLVIKIDWLGASLVRASASVAARVTSSPAPRAGSATLR